jgi:hypothetical protein
MATSLGKLALWAPLAHAASGEMGEQADVVGRKFAAQHCDLRSEVRFKTALSVVAREVAGDEDPAGLRVRILISQTEAVVVCARGCTRITSGGPVS